MSPIRLLLRRGAPAAGPSSEERSRRISSPRASMRVAWTITGGLVHAMRGMVGLVPRRVPVRASSHPSSHPSSHVVGDGRYQLLAPVGTGGAGTLYVAHDAVLDRTVAVKLLRPGHDETARARLQAEGRVAAGFSHHGIAQVFDYGEDIVDGEPSPYLVMQYVEGVTLAERLRGGRLPAARVADLVSQLADALSAVHAAGVVHRDVKPTNVMLTATGRTVLLDFGVARRADAEPLTLTGTIVGTLNYISPEQAAGEPATPRSDLYSLGMVAHEALTGVRAMARETQAATLLAHLSGAVEPLPVDVPAELRALVEQLVQRDPRRRPADAANVARLARKAALSADARRQPWEGSARPHRLFLEAAGGRTFRLAPRPPADPVGQTWRLAAPHGRRTQPHRSAGPMAHGSTPDPGGSDV